MFTSPSPAIKAPPAKGAYKKGTDGKLRWTGAGAPPPRKAPAAAPVKAKPRPLNPLDAEVNAAIGSRVAPLTGMIGERNKQYGAEAALATNADGALQTELAGLGHNYNASKSEAIGAVGAGQAASEAEQQRGNAFLQSVLGGFMSDPAAAQQAMHTGQLVAGAPGDLQNRTIAGQLALEQGAGNQSLALQSGAAAMQARAMGADALSRKSADTRTLQTQIAAIKAQSPLLRRQFATENEQMKLARDQLNQNQSQFDSTQTAQATQAELDRSAAVTLAKTRAAADPRVAEKAAADKAKIVDLQDQSLAHLTSALVDTGTLMKNPATPAGAAGQPLQKLGLSVGRDYIASPGAGGGVELTPAGAIRYFTQIAHLAPNYAYFAIKRYSPEMASRVKLVRQKGGGWTLAPGAPAKMPNQNVVASPDKKKSTVSNPNGGKIDIALP